MVAEKIPERRQDRAGSEAQMTPDVHRGSREQGAIHVRNSHGNGLRISTRKSRHHAKGILLIECLVYFSIWLVMGLAFAAFYRCVDYSKALSRNAADIVRVLQAG